MAVNNLLSRDDDDASEVDEMASESMSTFFLLFSFGFVDFFVFFFLFFFENFFIFLNIRASLVHPDEMLINLMEDAIDNPDRVHADYLHDASSARRAASRISWSARPGVAADPRDRLQSGGWTGSQSGAAFSFKDTVQSLKFPSWVKFFPLKKISFSRGNFTREFERGMIDVFR